MYDITKITVVTTPYTTAIFACPLIHVSILTETTLTLNMFVLTFHTGILDTWSMIISIITLIGIFYGLINITEFIHDTQEADFLFIHLTLRSQSPQYFLIFSWMSIHYTWHLWLLPNSKYVLTTNCNCSLSPPENVKCHIYAIYSISWFILSIFQLIYCDGYLSCTRWP